MFKKILKNEKIQEKISENSEPVKIILEKNLSEKFLDWFKFLWKIIFVLIIISAFIWVSKIEEWISQPWEIESFYVDIYWNQLDKFLTEKPWVAVVKINWMIWNRSMKTWINDWITASEDILTILEMAKNDAEISKIVLEINSPWWTVLDSEKIARKIEEIKKTKQVFAFMDWMAASWWYYIASQADKIYAYWETITWSIWVILSIPNAAELMQKIWVSQTNITSWEFKSMWNPFEKMDEKVEKVFQEMVDESYEKFISRIENWRKNLDWKQILKLADWRIYSWNQALENWLIDSLWWKEKLISDLQKEIWVFNLIEFWIAKSPFEELFSPIISAKKIFLWAEKFSWVKMMYIMN